MIKDFKRFKFFVTNFCGKIMVNFYNNFLQTDVILKNTLNLTIKHYPNLVICKPCKLKICFNA